MSHAPRDPNDPQWKGKGRAVPSQSAPELTHAGISVASGHRTNQHASSLPENLPEPWVHLNDHYYRFMSPKQQERRDIILQFWKQGLAQALKMAALPGPAGLMMADQYFAQDRVMRHGNLEADGDTFRANILFMRKLENSLNLYRASMKLERREDSRNMIYNLCREACQDGPEVCTRTHQSGKQIEELFDSVFGPCRDADVPSVRGPAVDITFHNVNRPEAKRPELNVAHTHGPQPGQLLHLTQGALAGRPQLQNDPINSVTVDEHRGDASMLNGLKAKSCRKNEDPAYGASDEAGKLGKREADRQAQRRHTILKHEVEKRRELSKGEAIAVLTKMQQKRCQGSSTVVTIQDYVRARLPDAAKTSEGQSQPIKKVYASVRLKAEPKGISANRPSIPQLVKASRTQMRQARAAGDQRAEANHKLNVATRMAGYMRARYMSQKQHWDIDTKTILSDLTRAYGETIFTQQEIEEYKASVKARAEERDRASASSRTSSSKTRTAGHTMGPGS